MTADQTFSIIAGNRRFTISAPKLGGPRLRYFGPSDAFVEMAAPTLAPLPSCADRRIENELFPLEGAGFFGEPALLAHVDRRASFSIVLQHADALNHRLRLHYEEQSRRFTLTLLFDLHESGVLESSATIVNTSGGQLILQRLNALTLPLPRWIDAIDATYGGWSNEGRHARLPLIAGKWERIGRAGRPGFDGGPHLVLCGAQTNEMAGASIGVALASSCNFALAAERMGHGEAHAFAAEHLLPGEIVLGEGDHYQTPVALAAIAMNGFGELSAQFHQFARRAASTGRTRRPVQLNSWEAVYFNVNEAIALELAQDAAAIGAERFVLDDGWFKGRANDRAALGDWTPDLEKFPRGLKPLADRVNALGMEFGLWVEPEMVSENSDLFRRHPDWIVSIDGEPGPTGRGQLVLDLHRAEIRDYLFGALDELLRTVAIGYLKWDCNRDLFPAATRDGPAAHRQIAGFYALLDRLREAHPNVSIESCASGGARMDFGVLQRADRFWTSDSTDPIERIRIQRRASLFFPVEMLAAHVGSSPNHWTRRQSTMTFRCLVALFGHFGFELDTRILSGPDRETLRRAIALYKEYRDILIDGRLLRFEAGDAGVDCQAIISRDETRALLRTLRTDEPTRQTRPPILLPNLPANAHWRLSELFIEGADKSSVFGEYSSGSLAFSGAELDAPHAGQGRLFLMERR